MPSDAREDVNQTRLLGAMLALLVQAALIGGAILALTRPAFLPRIIPREATLWLRPLPRIETQPKTIDARGRRGAPAAPTIVPRESPLPLPEAPSGPSTSD